MTRESTDSLDSADPLGAVLAACIEAVDRGEADAATAVARYPEYAAELRDFFAAQERARRLAAPLQSMLRALPTANTSDSASALPNPLGDFRILREVGRGGMGIVYEAEQVSLGRRVALKMLPTAAAVNPLGLQRFQNEARAAASLHHTNIVPVYAVGSEGGIPFYAMQFINGQTLAAILAQLRRRHSTADDDAAEAPKDRPAPMDRSGGPAVAGEPSTAHAGLLSTEGGLHGREYYRAVARLGVQAAEALDCAHQFGVVHRDIKPANLMMEAGGHLWVTDFGLARVLADASLTATGDVVGTLRYMSPEQALAKRGVIDHRADVYSLGATLYELLTLQPAFTGVDRQEVLRQIAFEEPPPPRRLNRAVPAELEIIIVKAMEKNPTQRYTTAGELADDLRRFVLDQPIRARRQSALESVRKWGRRHQPLVAAAAVLMILSILGLSVATTLIWNEKERTRIALQAETHAREEGEAREAETKAVLEFVENHVFAAARPEREKGGLGREVSLRKAIKSALPFVANSFTDQPLIEARLRSTLGLSFAYLSDSKTAAEQYEAARAIRAKLLGPDHPDTLASMMELANSYYYLGRYADALKLHEETLALRKVKLGPDHPNTLASMGNLANNYDALGRHADALKLREETLALMKAKLGPDDPDTLLGMANLAVSYTYSGRFAEALELRERTLALQKAKLGPDHHDTLLSMSGLADSYAHFGRFAEALKLQEETLALMKAKLGPDHQDTLLVMDHLALSYRYLGRHTEALKLLEETLELQKAKLGPDHRDTLASMYNLAFSYEVLGRHADALRLRKQTLALTKAKLGPDHDGTITIMGQVAVSYAALGRHADALSLRKETLALTKAKFGPDHPDTIISMGTLASSYDAVGRYAEALELCRQTAEMWEKLNRTDAFSLYNAACLRAVTAAVLKKATTPGADATRATNEHGDRAMAWLKQAVAAGFEDATHMEQDKDLDALRGRDDFKKLMLDLEAKKKSGASLK